MATRELTAAGFLEAVAAAPILLVDFWAAWCGPCRTFAPVFADASEQHPDIVFGKVDTEAEQALAAQAGFVSIPTLMAFRDDILVFSQSGALAAPQLERVIEAVRARDTDAVRAESAAGPASGSGVRS